MIRGRYKKDEKMEAPWKIRMYSISDLDLLKKLYRRSERSSSWKSIVFSVFDEQLRGVVLLEKFFSMMNRKGGLLFFKKYTCLLGSNWSLLDLFDKQNEPPPMFKRLLEKYDRFSKNLLDDYFGSLAKLNCL